MFRVIGVTPRRGILPLGLLLLLSSIAWSQQSKRADAGPNPPKCTDPLPTVEVPAAPHGLFVLLFPDSQVNSKATKYLLHDPVVCGADVYVVWNRVDKGPAASSRYNWSSVDEQMAPWLAAGKVVNLIVWATAYGPQGNATPDYVFAKVPSVHCPSFGHAPVFWHPDFVNSYRMFMKALIDKYGANPSIGYIRFGLGAGGEIYPACMYALQDYGFSENTWRKYLFDMLDYEKSLNSPKQLAVGLNAFGNPPDLDFTATIAERAVQDGIAIGNQGLTAEDVQNDAAGRPCMADWCRIFRQARGKVPLVLQTGGVTHPDHSPPTGSMGDILPFALGFHVQIFEIYAQDWLVAYDPSDPNYPKHHEEYQKVYESAAKVLGGR